MLTHQEKVNRIVAQLKKRRSGLPLSFKKKEISHLVPKPHPSKNKEEKIDLSDLNKILEINPKQKTCRAESGVTFSALVKETLKCHLVPLVVPELKTITIGGAVAGGSVESTSYKEGGFHDTCLEYEVITAKGDVLICTPDKENKKIFQMVHGTFGTLGIISKLKFELREAKPFVKLNYEPYATLEDYQRAINKHYKTKDVDFMDGIIHSPHKLILCVGNFVEKAPYTHSYQWRKPFYQSTGKRKEDYLKTYDYFFRYDADCHWIARNYGLENPLVRFLLGKFFLGSTKMLKKAKRLSFLFKYLKPEVVVDVFIPFSKFSQFFDFYRKEFNYFPLWVVPYKKKNYPWIADQILNKMTDELFIDLAIYGIKQKGNKNYYQILEDKLRELKGIKTLISYNYYDEKTFWKVWNKKNYFEVKKKTDPENIFRDLYQKTCGRN